MRQATRFTALLHAALMLSGIGAAQTTKPAVGTEQMPPQPPPAASQPSEEPNTAPVFWISSVEVLRSTHGPQLDVVRVRGLVTTEGWTSIQLVPITKGLPADGVLDLALVAEAPTDNTEPTSFPQVEAIFAIEPGHPFKGVRVHGAANRISLKTFPGFAESAAPPRDCVGCTGKYFLRKGENIPAHRSADTVVREEDLPLSLRVIRESDGIGTLESNPNRMTILLNEKNEIITAMWD